MKESLDFYRDVLLDRTPDELIGGLVIALLIGVGTSLIGKLLQSRMKDAMAWTTMLVVGANFACMLIAGGYVLRQHNAHYLEADLKSSTAWIPPGPPGPLMEANSDEIGRRMLRTFDADSDGELNSEEIQEVGEHLIDLLSRDTEKVDARVLGNSIRKTLLPGSGHRYSSAQHWNLPQ